jgi:hypothetical protein
MLLTVYSYGQIFSELTVDLHLVLLLKIQASVPSKEGVAQINEIPILLQISYKI